MTPNSIVQTRGQSITR